MTLSVTPISEAREIFGAFLLAPEDVGGVLAVAPDRLAADDRSVLGSVPYSRTSLEAARARGDVLVFRVASDGTAPLTTLRLLERFPETVQPQLLKGVGYQLKDEWTVDQEPFTATATCRSGWHLVHGTTVPASRNLSYEQQEAALERYADVAGLAGRLSRRTAIEAIYDTILLNRAHGTRLLEREWDWSSTPTQDGGFITVGEFSSDGLKIIGYSRAVRFGTLGVCPQQ